MRLVGCTLLLVTLTSSAYAAGGYTEVWNPPEARGGGVHHGKTVHKLAARRHGVPHTVKVHTRRPPTLMTKLAMKQRLAPDGAHTREPDVSDIPRQITPEGNVLRVDSRSASVEVAH